MFLYRHKLYGIVSGLNDERNNIFCKFTEAACLFFGCGHADMSFINYRRTCGRYKFFNFPFIWFFRIPYLGGKYLRPVILNNPVRIRRNPLSLTIVPVDR